MSELNESEDGREWYENDLQLAAELGMALLRRNQELENIVYQKQLIIDEQSQEIQLMSKQTSTLRELNESRLKVYEQLEQSISDLEKTNQKLHHESSIDKKRIQNLCNSVELLEKKCEELESMVNELKIPNNKNYHSFAQTEESYLEQNLVLDSLSIEDKTKEIDYEYEILRLQSMVSQMGCQLSREQRKYYELELERDILIQENAELQSELHLLEIAENNITDLENECSTEERTDSRIHKEAMSPLSNNMEDEVEQFSPQECTLVQLKNGIIAYGNQESLETVCCDVVEQCCDKINTSNGISLLTELDTHYNDLLKDYKNLTRHGKKSDNFKIESLSAGDNNNTENNANENYIVENQLESASEIISPVAADCRYIHTGVQTELTGDVCASYSQKKILDLNSTSSISGHFDHSCPMYKKLFEEIFTILKKSLHPDTTVKSTAVCSKPAESDRSAIGGDETSNKIPQIQNNPGKWTYAEVLLNGRYKKQRKHVTS